MTMGQSRSLIPPRCGSELSKYSPQPMPSNRSAMTPINQGLPADPAATEDKGFHSVRHKIRSIGPFWDFDFMYSYDCCTICSRIGSSTSLSRLIYTQYPVPVCLPNLASNSE